MIELTPEPQLTLTCQAPLISFVNSLCCLPNWGPVTCGFVFTRANAWTRSQNRHFALTWYAGLFNRPRMGIIPQQFPNYRWILLTQYWCMMYIDFCFANSLNLTAPLFVFFKKVFCCRASQCFLSTACARLCFRWKQLPFNLYRDVLESLLASLQTVVCHALHVAVHTEPHVTPAAYPLAVQFNQADDMQHDIPRRSVPLTASLGGLDRGDVWTAGALSDLSGAQIKLACDSGWVCLLCVIFIKLKSCVADFLIWR